MQVFSRIQIRRMGWSLQNGHCEILTTVPPNLYFSITLFNYSIIVFLILFYYSEIVGIVLVLYNAYVSVLQWSQLLISVRVLKSVGPLVHMMAASCQLAKIHQSSLPFLSFAHICAGTFKMV